MKYFQEVSFVFYITFVMLFQLHSLLIILLTYLGYFNTISRLFSIHTTYMYNICMDKLIENTVTLSYD